MNGQSTDPSTLARNLGDLFAQLPVGGSDQWREVESTAQALANALRVKGGPVDNHTVLGRTLLPQTLASLLKASVDAPSPEDLDTARTEATFEILRVGGEFVYGPWQVHDNRERLLESGYLQTVVSLLESYAEKVPSTSIDMHPYPIAVPHLKVIKTAFGVLLNASIGYEPVRFRLISLEAAVTILRLSAAIYPPGSWVADQNTPVDSWTLRSGLSAWAWRTISQLKGDDAPNEQEEPASPNARPLFGPDVLPLLIKPLQAFIPPYKAPTGPVSALPELQEELFSTDFDVLEEACMLLESLCLDVEDARLSLARGLTFPEGEHGGVRCLEEMLTFIDRGDYPPAWKSEPASERARKEKAFDVCKAAVIKAVVEVAGEEKNIDVLWDDSETEKPGGEFVSRMLTWVRTHKSLKETNRDDLIICATLCLGNLVRREAHSIALVNPPVSLAADLAALLEPETDIKVKHGVVGLLKHIAQTPQNRAALGEAGVIHRLAASQVWSERVDIAEIVQVSAIGIAKHMCNGNVDNCFALVLPLPDQEPETTALSLILALTRRSDSVAVKSEGTRVLVNAIKSLWSSDASGGDKRKQAMQVVLSPPCALALAQLVGRSKKYPLLVNEGVVALTLLSTHAVGTSLVLDAVTTPLSQEVASPIPASTASASSEASPTVHSARTLDTLFSVLKNREKRFQPEVRANVCALLGQLGRKNAAGEARIADVEKVKEQARPYLERAAAAVSSEPEGQEAKSNSMVGVAAKRALDAWA